MDYLNSWTIWMDGTLIKQIKDTYGETRNWVNTWYPDGKWINPAIKELNGGATISLRNE